MFDGATTMFGWRKAMSGRQRFARTADYLNPWWCFSESIKEHWRITSLVLKRLREHKLFLYHDKCKFKQTTIEYLSLIISKGEICMDPVKVAGVTEWPTPKSKRRYSPSWVLWISITISSKDSHIVQNPCSNSRRKIGSGVGRRQSRKCSTRLRIELPPPSFYALLMIRIEADNSDYATGEVLSQQSSDNLKWHPIAFYSKSLNAVKCNYDIHDKEMLAVMRALEEWWHFLEGVKEKVEIWTDHKNLEYFMTVKKLGVDGQCWQVRVLMFFYLFR
jgi:hypothetical protein